MRLLTITLEEIFQIERGEISSGESWLTPYSVVSYLKKKYPTKTQPILLIHLSKKDEITLTDLRWGMFTECPFCKMMEHILFHLELGGTCSRCHLELFERSLYQSLSSLVLLTDGNQRVFSEFLLSFVDKMIVFVEFSPSFERIEYSFWSDTVE